MSSDKRSLSIEVKITDRCNQACPHCANRDGIGEGKDIDWAFFNHRLEEWGAGRDDSICDIEEVRLTGGEPLINFDAVTGIAECCHRLHIRSGINTNGLLISPERMRRLKESSLEIVKISFDATKSPTYICIRGPIPSLESHHEVIGDLVEKGFKVILRFTLMRPNRDELISSHILAEKLGVYKFQIKPLIPAGRAETSDFFLNRDMVDETLRDLMQARAGTRLRTEILCWPQAEGLDLFYKGCGNINKIYISPDMKVSICNYIAKIHDSPIGDLSLSPLEQILRRRCDGAWSERLGRFDIIRGCPNTGHFEKGA